MELEDTEFDTWDVRVNKNQSLPSKRPGLKRQTQTYPHIYTFSHRKVPTHTHIHIYSHTYTYIHTIYVRMLIHKYTYMYTHIHIHPEIHTHIHVCLGVKDTETVSRVCFQIKKGRRKKKKEGQEKEISVLTVL